MITTEKEMIRLERIYRVQPRHNNDVCLAAEQGCDNGVKVSVKKCDGYLAQNWKVTTRGGPEAISLVPLSCTTHFLDMTGPQGHVKQLHLWEPFANNTANQNFLPEPSGNGVNANPKTGDDIFFTVASSHRPNYVFDVWYAVALVLK
jgi:hypothetical protein